MKKNILLIIVSFFLISCNTGLPDAKKQEYTKKGKEIAQATMKELGVNLIKQMKLGGPQVAVPFCNVAAYPLTDKIAKKYNVKIKRTSHKIRNQKNSPNQQEKRVLKAYLEALNKKEPLKPVAQKEEDKKIHYYAPIIIQQKCLACHGILEKEVTKKTDSTIKTFYPKDKATGFEVGDLRGIWSITFND